MVDDEFSINLISTIKETFNIPQRPTCAFRIYIRNMINNKVINDESNEILDIIHNNKEYIQKKVDEVLVDFMDSRVIYMGVIKHAIKLAEVK